MVKIHNLEFHVAHACNLSCQQCSHYSNLRLAGSMATPDEADQAYRLWSSRVRPKQFALLGGEPALHPRLIEHVETAARHWPKSNRLLVSNGLHLHRHPDLPAALVKHGWKLDISRHGRQYDLQPVVDLLVEWKSRYPQLRTHIRHSQGTWMRQYRVVDGKPKPFNSPPRKAWSVCMQRHCTQLFQNHLWKCPAVAYFSMMQHRTRIADDPDWESFRQYKALSPDASDDQVAAFFNRRAIPQCRLCPAKQERFIHPNPTVDHGIGI